MVSEPLLLNATDAAKRLGISRALLYEMAADGRLGPVPVLPGRNGRGGWYSANQLEDWVCSGCKPRSEWLQVQKEALNDK